MLGATFHSHYLIGQRVGDPGCTAFIGPAHVNAALSSTDALCMHSAHKGLWQKLMMCN